MDVMSSFQVQPARVNWSIVGAHFSILRNEEEMSRTGLDLRIRVPLHEENRQKAPRSHVSTVEPGIAQLRAGTPSRRNFRILPAATVV